MKSKIKLHPPCPLQRGTEPKIALLDYEMGNLHSVSKALEHAGADVDILTQPAEMDKYSALVLPGVGNFGDCAEKCREHGFDKLTFKWISIGKPFLGICVGMQLLMEESEEAPGIPGLGIFKGKVKLFKPKDPALKVPQMGWNQVDLKSKNPIFNDIPNNSYFYFVHSYYVDPENAEIILGETDYGIKYCSFIQKDNIFATQFHPEKSQKIGLKLLENFVKIVISY